jgi:hypothetical protein
MYCIVHKQDNLIQAAIHLGTHDHSMAKGHSRKVFDQVESLVREEVSHTPRAIMSTIALATSKTFLFKHLLNEDREGQGEVLKGEKLCQMMDKFITLSSPNVQNLVASFKH